MRAGPIAPDSEPATTDPNGAKPMKIIAQMAMTRPRSASGVSVCTRVLMAVICIIIPAPTGTSSSIDSQSVVDWPSTARTNMPPLKKSPPELIEVFLGALPRDERVERRQMFGFPAAFVGGNMFAGLFEEHVIVRLSEQDSETLRAIPGASVFEPMKGRPMKEYTVLPAAMHKKAGDLRSWLSGARDYGATLPAKSAKKKTVKKSGAKPIKKVAKKTKGR